jgi:hypothetical protein
MAHHKSRPADLRTLACQVRLLVADETANRHPWFLVYQDNHMILLYNHNSVAASRTSRIKTFSIKIQHNF